MLRPLAAALAVALSVPVPAHAREDENYRVRPVCKAVAVYTSYDRVEYAVYAYATATSTVAVPVSTTVRCRFYDPWNGQAYWTGVQAAPGAAAATAGNALGYVEMATCAQGAATFSDGVTVETPAC